MINIYELLVKYNLSIPEDKKAEFEEAFKANYKTVAEVEKITTARDNYKTQLETAQTALEEFKGVNVNELNTKIEQLTNDLAAKETEHQQKLADIEFEGKVADFLKKAGAKNVTAAKALIDLKAIRESKNQDADLQAAIDSSKEENGYLYGSDEPFNNPTYRTENSGNPGDPMARARAAMGLPPESK